MNEQRILEKLADILRKNGYKVTKLDYTEEDYPSIEDWCKNIGLRGRARSAIRNGNYTGDKWIGRKGKEMVELISDVKTGKILEIRGVGEATRADLAHALSTTLNIDMEL
ncbi:MAG TPA: hypothetical protein VJ964_00070 [Balneolaceae bacterium]|nr:hypothetical protein [Balneolaceae bacterium]